MPEVLRVVPIEAPLPAATREALAHLSLASGQEHAVRSPALELQEALESMLAGSVRTSSRPANVIGLMLGATAAAGLCTMFWLSLARMVMSAI